MRLAVALCVGALLCALAGGALAQDANVAAKRAAGCKTALDLIASQDPTLPMHPVFQEIFNSPSLKGTLFVPTARAWDNFFATVRQRQGNPEAPALVARYGQVMLFHLAQDINVPIAQPTPGASRFAFDTASTLQCSVGPGLPNNRVVVRKTPQAIFLEHGTGNATIVSQPIGYCGGEAYLVDQVLVPCSDVSAIMGEIANVPSPCKNNVEGVLQRNGLSYYNALLLATGVNRPIFAAVRNFTIFAPTDAAILSAYESGSFDFPELFAKNKAQLSGIVAYQSVPQYAYTAPGRLTFNMETLLSQGVGNASCANPALSWRQDGLVYGGTGAGKLGSTYDRGCAAVIFSTDSLLQPCCKPMVQLASSIRAAPGSVTAKALAYAKSKAEESKGLRSTFILPTEAAWQALYDEAAAANVTITPEMVNDIISYLFTGAEVADVVESATPVKTALSLAPAKAQKEVCAKGTNATLVFAYVPAPGAEADDGAAAVSATTGAPAAPLLPGSPAAPGVATVAQLMNGFRRLQAAKLPTGAAGSASLLLPTAFVGNNRKRDGVSVINGPVMIVDGSARELGSAVGIPVSRTTHACDGTIFHVDAVPLPCNLLRRTKAVPAPKVAAPKPAAPLSMTINKALVNTTNIPAAVPDKAPTSSAAATAPLLGGIVGATLLAALLL